MVLGDLEWNLTPPIPLIFNSPKLGEFGGTGWSFTYIKKNLNCQICSYDINLYLYLYN